MKNPILASGWRTFSASLVCFLVPAISLSAQTIYTGTGLWTDAANWDTGAVPGDNSQAIINGTCEIAENIGAANTFNPSRLTVGQGTVGVLNVTGGTLSGAHGGGNGLIVGEGAGGDGTVTIAEGAALRSQGANMVVRIGDDLGAVGRISVAGELLNFKFLEIINGTLEMLPTGINNKFNEATPSFIGANGTLAFVIDGADVGALERANNNGLQMTIDPAATLQITLGGSFAINDSWILMSYATLVGQFAQGTSFTNQQGYTFAVDYGSGNADVVVLTLTSDAQRPQVNSFAANPPSASAGAAVQLAWDAGNFDTLSIDQGVGDVTAQGGQSSVTVNPTETTTYTFSASLGAVTVTREVTVVIDELPEIASFTGLPGTIAPGESATLSWDVSGATAVTISDGVGAVAGQGSQAVAPAATTTYTLTATNATGSVMADVTVTVDAVAAALIHQYLAQRPGQTSGALLDSVGSSNFDIRNGDLRAVSGSDHTTFTHEIGRANNDANDGGDNGDGFATGRTFEIWIRTGELDRRPQVVFDTGTPADGLAILIDQKLIRVLQSNGGVRTADVDVSTPFVNTQDDFIQIVVVLDADAESLNVFARGAAGGSTQNSGGGGGVPVGRASLFSWSGFAGGIAGGLGGLGDGEIPAELTTFKGAVALLNVYGRALSGAETEDAFSRWTANVPVADSDLDFLPDFWEQRHFGGLGEANTDDSDMDTLSNFDELACATDPTESDTDFDGLDDPTEVEGMLGTDPTDADTDDDLLTDGEEVNGDPATNPLLADSDSDTYSDSVEINEGSDPNDAGSLPIAFIGVAPVAVDQSLGTANSYSALFPNTDTLDATFRMCVDLDEKTDGEREVLFETGGGGTGFSLTYEAGSQLVLRASGSTLLAEVIYPLSAAQLGGGDLELVWTFDIDDAAAPGNSTIRLFVDGVEVGSSTMALGGDWTGTNGSSFGIAQSGIAGIAGGGDLTAVDFTSGSINLRKGLQFYSDVLFEGAAPPLRITAFSFDPATMQLSITWDSVAGANYSVEHSSDLLGWQEQDDPTATGPSTSVTLSYDPAVTKRIYVRVRELGN